MPELADYLKAVAVLDGLPAWYSSEQARLRAQEQQAKLKAEADAGRRRDEIGSHRQLVDKSLEEVRTALRDVALGQAVPATIRAQAANPPKGADDLARDIKETTSDIRRLSRKLKTHRQETHARRLAEDEAARERERQRQAAEDERRRRERDTAAAALAEWNARKQRALTMSALAAVVVLAALGIAGITSGTTALILVGLVAAVVAFAGLFAALKPKSQPPTVPDLT